VSQLHSQTEYFALNFHPTHSGWKKRDAQRNSAGAYEHSVHLSVFDPMSLKVRLGTEQLESALHEGVHPTRSKLFNMEQSSNTHSTKAYQWLAH
jgi:hypothetical protein